MVVRNHYYEHHQNLYDCFHSARLLDEFAEFHCHASGSPQRKERLELQNEVYRRQGSQPEGMEG